MYNWRITSFLVFTSGFYCVALISTGVTLGGITFLSSSSSSGQDKIKKEANVSLDSKITTNGHATQPTIKSEEEIESGEESALSLSNLSDTAATFPTLARQMPIRYPVQSLFQQGAASASSSRLSRIKIEDQDDDEVAGIEASTALEPLAATTAGEFAEDEDEEEEEEREGDGGRDRDKDRDSGIGTSVEESAKEAGRGLQRRRGGGRGQSSSSRSGAGVRP